MREEIEINSSGEESDNSKHIENKLKKVLNNNNLSYLAEKSHLPQPPSEYRARLINKIIEMVKLLESRRDDLHTLKDIFHSDAEFKWCCTIIATLPNAIPSLPKQIPHLSETSEKLTKILHEHDEELETTHSTRSGPK